MARGTRCGLATTLSVVLALGCDGQGEIGLSKPAPEGIPDVPVPPENGPRLGAITKRVPVRERPARDAVVVGLLHAGATVPRAEQPYSTRECDGGWYPIRPRGFVCVDEGATVDVAHPTLAAMAIQPQLDADLPYTYARTTRSTELYEVDPDRDNAVRVAGKVPSRSGMAVVGSWNATDENGAAHRLALMTDGRFVDATHLKAAKPSAFQGVELDADTQLPLAYVVKRGVNAWKIDGQRTTKLGELERRTRLDLSGRFRTVRKVQFWESADGTWVRHRDVTIIPKRHKLPEFATAETRWVDVSVITGAAVAYEGTRPVFATLVSVGRDRLGEPENSDSTARGEFAVVAKHVTALSADPSHFANLVDIFDTPWALELASGQLVHGAYWHSRFGVEHGPGNIQLSPADARRLFAWAGAEVPAGWHSAVIPPDAPKTIVNIRK